ncbi:DNA gyrase subunit A [Thermodesulfovibrio aggregans]|uniref:DNA gyrase subunit A n=1 Tax=Thermodesulfovibrio aggregans TaxID=86166 RepID=A0A0U9HQV1_9BACT|nr:DNA gyrase subunit A [Thermodesulfovibrio aggregans]GAQ95188.1 DNA gyrase subunit A [Thermodesulfovibrio aggregans]
MPNVLKVSIEEEMKTSYLDYAMSVIIGRALPDVRDGLKPVQRRILYAMFREGLLAGKKYSKCAGVVGEVLKKYHPHGDQAVYDALVRLAQDFNMRYPLIDGQGNFGSIDGDPPAAYRYTEARLTKIAEELLQDIDKETVPFVPNFDATTQEPLVLPTRIPNLLINGSSGIAVGMATNIPPHNLNEIIDALVKLLEEPETSAEELMHFVKGPDFPTGGIIYGLEGIKEFYLTGKGLIKVRAKVKIEREAKGKKAREISLFEQEQEGKSAKERIVITEIPYQVNKARLIEKIAELVREKKIEGITEIRDESNREGIRVVLELKRGEMPQVILNNLYKHTQMETTFGAIMLAIVDGQPKILNLKDSLWEFLKHRKDVVLKRTAFDLKKAEHQAHILLGLKIAVENLDEVISIIRKSKNPEEAKARLMSRFPLTEIQAQAILDMRLQRLTGLEREKIVQDYEAILKEIERLKAILESETLVREIIRDELLEIKQKYGDERRTQIVSEVKEINVEDLITQEDMVITLTHLGYIKRTSLSDYRSQKRGGKGLTPMETVSEDYLTNVLVGSTHDHIMFFSNQGRVYCLKVYQIPEAGRLSRGKAIVNLLPLREGEKITTALVCKDLEQGYLMMFTKKGFVKKTSLEEFKNIRSKGVIAIDLEDSDELISVVKTDGKAQLIIATKKGMAIRFDENNVRPMGRTARGVIGIRFTEPEDEVVSADVVSEGSYVLTITEKGIGKKTPIEEYRLQHRGGSGVKNIKLSPKTGNVVASLQVKEDDEVIICSSSKIIRLKVSQIRPQGRSTTGVRLIDLSTDDTVVSVGRILEGEGEENVNLQS